MIELDAELSAALTNAMRARRRRARVSGGGGFDPASLFAAGEQGAWYEPSPTTCFTDTARTTAAAVGDPVAGMTDLSGRGNHATQATLAQRPILRQSGALFYLECDGTDDGMVTSSINFTATDKMSVFAGAQKLSDAAAAIVVELSADINSNAGSFYLSAPNTSGTGEQYATTSRGAAALATGQVSLATANTVPAPDTAVLTGLHDIAGDSSILRRNGTAYTAGTADKGAGNFGNYPLFIGRRNGASLPFNGRIYSMIVLGRTATPAEITATEAYIALKTGVTL
jgi:hypothetical protein